MQVITGAASHETDVRGIRFHWLEWGDASAPPFVLLHGLTGHAHTWDHIAPALSERYRVLVPDQRGHGDTGTGDSYTTQEFVDDLDALRGVWGISRFVLMGLSMGGHNAIAYAAQHSEAVSHLIVIDIPPKMERGANSANATYMAKLAADGHRVYATVDDAFADARATNTTAPDANLRYRTELNLRETPGGLQWKYDPRAPSLWDPSDLTAALPSMNMPVLLVRGGLTQVLSARTAQAMVDAWPDSEFAEIADSGHSVPTDRPEKLAPIVLDWLTRRGD